MHTNNNGDIDTSLYEHIAEHSHSVGDQIDYYEDDCELGSREKSIIEEVMRQYGLLSKIFKVMDIQGFCLTT